MSRVAITIDLAVYPLEIVLRACHAFSAQCCVFANVVDDASVVIELEACDELRDPARAFRDALRDIHARAAITAETEAIRESLTAEAFGEDEDEAQPSRPIRIVR